MTGMMLGAARRQIAIVMDGFISTAAAASRLRSCPRGAARTCSLDIESQEPGHRILLLTHLGHRSPSLTWICAWAKAPELFWPCLCWKQRCAFTRKWPPLPRPASAEPMHEPARSAICAGYRGRVSVPHAVPLPKVAFAPDGLSRAVKFFPLVGLAVGAGAALLERVLTPHLARPASALVVLLYLVLVTGCLHEDGLADVADSLGGWNPAQRLAILRDSRIGSYGAAALVLSLVGRAVLLAELPLEHFTAYLVSAHVLCRWSMLPLSYYLPPAGENEGQGRRIAGLTSTASLIFGSALTIAIVVVGLHKGATAPILCAMAIPMLCGWFYMRKFGGITGDCFGATNQLTEIAVYLCGAWKA